MSLVLSFSFYNKYFPADDSPREMKRKQQSLDSLGVIPSSVLYDFSSLLSNMPFLRAESDEGAEPSGGEVTGGVLA